MKRITTCLYGTVLASTAMGATVDFVQVDPSVGAYDWRQVNKFDVYIAETDFATFDAVSLLIGTFRADLAPTFEYDPDFEWPLPPPPPPHPCVGPYCALGGAEVEVGGFNDRNDWMAPLRVGVLTVEVANVWAEGVERESITIGADSEWEITQMGAAFSSIASAGEVEHVYGMGYVPFPEPATLVLLVTGGLLLLRRR